MSFTVDTNVLVYASNPVSDLHERAVSFLETCAAQTEPFCLTWPTIMGYLRISTNPSVLRPPLSPNEAMSNIETLMALPHVRCISELDGYWEIYREIAGTVPIRGALVSDAHIAAILRQHGIKRIYTHDSDFRKFSFLDVRDPFA